MQIPHTVGLLCGEWESERKRDSRWVFSLQSSEKWSITNCCAQIAEPSTRATMCTYFGDWGESYSPNALKANSYAHEAFQYRYKVPKTTKSLLLIYIFIYVFLIISTSTTGVDSVLSSSEAGSISGKLKDLNMIAEKQLLTH